MHFCMEVLVILNGRRVFLKIYIYLYKSVWYTSFGNYKNGVYTVLKKNNYLRELTFLKKW